MQQNILPTAVDLAKASVLLDLGLYSVVYMKVLTFAKMNLVQVVC